MNRAEYHKKHIFQYDDAKPRQESPKLGTIELEINQNSMGFLDAVSSLFKGEEQSEEERKAAYFAKKEKLQAEAEAGKEGERKASKISKVESEGVAIDVSDAKSQLLSKMINVSEKQPQLSRDSSEHVAQVIMESIFAPDINSSELKIVEEYAKRAARVGMDAGEKFESDRNEIAGIIEGMKNAGLLSDAKILEKATDRAARMLGAAELAGAEKAA
ncbi:MAG: hypothetical protein ABIA47_01860 [bacterium]